MIRQVDFDADIDSVVLLWRAYLDWANDELDERFGFRLSTDDSIAEDLASLDKFAPPAGRLLLAVDGDDAVGVGCLKRIRDDTAEIKRMYVEPEQRGNGVGRSLLDALLVAGRHEGYSRVLLDSVGFMHDAHRLYRSAGFVDAPPHPESEIPETLQQHWVFMELELTNRLGPASV